jgi:hypothetical protein
MWPQVPEDINSLSLAALAALANEIKAVAQAKLIDPSLSAEDRTEVNTYLAKRQEIVARHGDLATQLAAAAALADEPDVEVPAETPAEEPEATEPEAAPEEAKVPVSAAAAPAKVPTTFGTPSTTTSAGPKLTPDYLKATRGVDGKNAGDGYESWAELAMAAVKKAKTFAPDSTDRFEMAKIKGNYPKERILGDDIMLNVAKFERDELTAALCAPATPYYNLACMNTLRRPVFNSLPQFQAPRMKVSIMPSPSLSDIDGGYGQWLDTDDDNPSAQKVCDTVECGSPTEYKMYGVWRCLTVKNMLAMSYPELVEAWLNRLGAAHSRLAETLLLDAMGDSAVELQAATLGYGAAVSVTSTILNYLTLYQETQRWDITDNMEAWAHRYVLNGIKMDILRRRRTDGNVSVPSTAQVEAMFRDVGVNIHWVIDTPTWGTAVPAVGDPNLNVLPNTVDILIAPPGKYALMDRGELAIGVTGNNIYRDNESNSRNQFTFFFENFEGVVDTTSCPAHILSIPVCWTGIQVDDQLVACDGSDIGNYQS